MLECLPYKMRLFVLSFLQLSKFSQLIPIDFPLVSKQLYVSLSRENDAMVLSFKLEIFQWTAVLDFPLFEITVPTFFSLRLGKKFGANASK
jgi:hypothetical protein